MVDRERFVEPHQEPDLIGWSAPILGREGVDGEPLDAEFESTVHHIEQGLLARGVAIGPLQAPMLGPIHRSRP